MDQPFYSPLLVDEFFSTAEFVEIPTDIEGMVRYRLRAMVQDVEISISSGSIKRIVNFDTTGPLRVAGRINSYSAEAQNIMARKFLHIPSLQNNIKAVEIKDGGELLAHVAHLVGASLIFKTGNVNRFTMEQWEYTAAIMGNSILNWPQVLFKTLMDQVDKYNKNKAEGKTKFKSHCRILTKIFLTYPALATFLAEHPEYQSTDVPIFGKDSLLMKTRRKRMAKRAPRVISTQLADEPTESDDDEDGAVQADAGAETEIIPRATARPAPVTEKSKGKGIAESSSRPPKRARTEVDDDAELKRAQTASRAEAQRKRDEDYQVKQAAALASKERLQGAGSSADVRAPAPSAPLPPRAPPSKKSTAPAPTPPKRPISTFDDSSEEQVEGEQEQLIRRKTTRVPQPTPAPPSDNPSSSSEYLPSPPRAPTTSPVRRAPSPAPRQSPAPPPTTPELSMVLSLLQQLQKGQERIESQFELQASMITSQAEEIAAIKGEITRIGADIRDKHFLTPQQWNDAIDQMNALFKNTLAELHERIGAGIKLTDGQAFIDAIKQVETGVASDIQKLLNLVTGESDKLVCVMDKLKEIKDELEKAPSAHTALAPTSAPSSSAAPLNSHSLLTKLDVLKELIVTHFNAAHSSADRRAERISADILSAQNAIEANVQAFSENSSHQQSITQRTIDEYQNINVGHLRFIRDGVEETFGNVNRAYQLSKQIQRSVKEIEEGLKDDEAPPNL